MGANNLRASREVKISSYSAKRESVSMKTSVSHPLQIAAVSAGPGRGRVGLTLCPGKYDPHAMSGPWNRDLALDLDMIRDWGAAAVVTLVEPEELALLRVEHLGEEVVRRQMSWFHLPIVDGDIPDERFARAWEESGAELRSILQDGFDVLVHCRGGLGRAGTIAARLLVELGMEPAAAIKKVRKVRSGAIENDTQEHFVLDLGAVRQRPPAVSDAAIRDRAVGALLGLAVGDAVGTTLEFKQRDSYEPLTDMVGGGPFRLKAGQWTDDTALALALADSLQDQDDLDERDLLRRFVEWHEQGTYSCTGTCFDIGTTTSRALSHWKKTSHRHSGSTDPDLAGNGSLMRLAPVAIRFWHDLAKLRDVAARQSKTTHAAPDAVDACVAFADLLADAIAGKPRSDVLKSRSENYTAKIGGIMQGSWRGKARPDIQASGYVAHTLEAALWSVGRTSDYRSAVLLAANLGDDADTTAAVAGQLAGALYGASGIPEEWVGRVAWRDRIIEMASGLLVAA